jgi:hypothetical protein
MRGFLALCNADPRDGHRPVSGVLTESRGQAVASERSRREHRSDTLTRKTLPGPSGIIAAFYARLATVVTPPIRNFPMRYPLRRLVALALGAAVLTSCDANRATLPRLDQATPEAPSASLLGALTSLLSVDGLQRTTALAQPITVTKAIGAEGGTLAIPAAGVTVVVPQGALAATTTITMTARAGTLVAYDFAPHGITFAKPLVFTQQLRGTNASLLTAPLLKLGYYSDASLLTQTGGLVSELLGGVVNTLSWSFTSTIPHFSGYVVCSDRR